MRIFSTIICSGLLLVWLSSCIREPPCEQLSMEDNVELLPQWPNEADKPSNVFVQCYPRPDGTVIQNFIPASGGYIYLYDGEYQLLLYSNNSPRINFRNMETLESAEAYIDDGMQPDELYCGSMADVEIQNENKVIQIKIPMVNMVHEYPFVYSGVVGIQYVNRISVSIDGINQAVNMGSRIPTSTTSVVNCPYSLTADGFYGTLRCFGHGNEKTKHSFSVRFDYGGRVLDRVYDVTDMVNEQGRIIIHDKIKFEPLDEGDINTGVGDWEDDVVDVPVN